MQITTDRNLIRTARKLAEDFDPDTQDMVNNLAMVYQGYVDLINKTGWVKSAHDAREKLRTFVEIAGRETQPGIKNA
jgi:hypothetical protein